MAKITQCSYLPSHLHSIRKFCDCDKTSLDILGVSASLIATNWFLERRLSSDLSSCMCASLKPERVDGFHSHSVLKNLSVIGWCLVNTNIVAPKTVALLRGPETYYFYFLENSYNDFEYTSVIYGDGGRI